MAFLHTIPNSVLISFLPRRAGFITDYFRLADCPRVIGSVTRTEIS